MPLIRRPSELNSPTATSTNMVGNLADPKHTVICCLRSQWTVDTAIIKDPSSVGTLWSEFRVERRRSDYRRLATGDRGVMKSTARG
jgi:hypothetical protein